MSDNQSENNNDRPDDDVDPQTAPEVPEFAHVSEEDQKSDDESSKKIIVMSSDDEEETTLHDSETEEVETAHNDKKEVVETYDHQLQSSAEAPAKPKRNHKRLFAYGSFVIVNIAVLAATLVVLRMPHKHVAAQTTPMPVGDPGNIPADTTKVPEAPKSQHYVSDALKLEFDYPSDWRIESNLDNTYIAIQSAQFDAKQSGGTTAKARAVITIYAKYPDTTDDVKNSSIITADSEKLTYQNPTKVQRADTNLSYSRFSSQIDANSVTASFISSDLVYKPGQLVGSKNYRKTNPYIIITIDACDTLCTSTIAPLPIGVQTLKDMEQFTAAKSIITSMRFNE